MQEYNHPFQATTSAGSPVPFPTTLPRRILVVDHDPYVCHLSADVLIRHGYEVNAAEDGAAGWEELQAYHYDLLITERDLPKISGVTLVRILRAARLALPVVMVAKRPPARELARSPALQLAATLLKPLPVDALLDTVTIVLRATSSPCERIVPPPNSQNQSPADSWQLKPISTAASTVQVHQDIGYGYHRWGLNE